MVTVIELPNLVNFRDFEGYPCEGEGFLRGGVFARSDNPCSLSKEEIRALRARGFTTVIDLRRDNEVREIPDLLETEEGFSYHRIILNDEAYMMYGPLDTPEHISEAYYSKLTVSADRIAKIFRLFASADSGVLFHCESGKDRTGTVAALLLLLNNVPDEVIIEDYDLSSRMLTAEMKDHWKYDPSWLPKGENFAPFLRMFHQEYPATDRYFQKIGITEEEIRAIKIKFSAGIKIKS